MPCCTRLYYIPWSCNDGRRRFLYLGTVRVTAFAKNFTSETGDVDGRFFPHREIAAVTSRRTISRRYLRRDGGVYNGAPMVIYLFGRERERETRRRICVGREGTFCKPAYERYTRVPPPAAATDYKIYDYIYSYGQWRRRPRIGNRGRGGGGGGSVARVGNPHIIMCACVIMCNGSGEKDGRKLRGAKDGAGVSVDD